MMMDEELRIVTDLVHFFVVQRCEVSKLNDRVMAFVHEGRVAIRKVRQLEKVIAPFAAVLDAMVEHTENLYTISGPVAWNAVWKPVSHRGCDVVKGRWCDYMNIIYTTVLFTIVEISPDIRRSMDRLAWHWPSLTVSKPTPLSQNRVEMLGDVVECVMAGFRGQEIFRTALSQYHMPTIFNMINDISRGVQWLDAFSDSGRVHYKELFTPRFFANQEFARAWSNVDQRARLIKTLIQLL